MRIPRASAPPLFGGFGGPFLSLVFMALGAGVRGSDFYRKVRTRNPNAVITSVIDAHERFVRHMAVNATRASAVDRVKVVRRGVVRFRLMALQAQRVTGHLQLHRVRVVAIRAPNIRVKHFALHEGSVDVNLFIDLSVMMIELIGDD